MKINSLGIFFLFAIIGLTSCFNDDDFADAPRISLQGDNPIIFKSVGGFGDADSLIVLIDFEDGDGDLGLDEDEINPPYNLRNYYNNRTGQLFDFRTQPISELLRFSDRDAIDTLPGFNDVTECLNWNISPNLTFGGADTTLNDTIYFQFNPRHYNLLVDFFLRNNAGEFEEFDFRLEADCSITFDGRFPLISEENDRGDLEGSIRYRMPSPFFELSLGADTPMFLRLQLIDRSGNLSNVIETPEFTLSGIRVN